MTMDKQPLPKPVKLIVLWHLLIVLPGLFLGMVFLSSLGAPSIWSGIIFFIGPSIFSFFIARGLWKAQNWARIATLVFAAYIVLLSVLFWEVFGVVTIPIILIQLFIAGYLLLNNSKTI